MGLRECLRTEALRQSRVPLAQIFALSKDQGLGLLKISNIVNTPIIGIYTHSSTLKALKIVNDSVWLRSDVSSGT